MNLDFVLNVVIATAGLIGGIAGSIKNAKKLVDMSNDGSRTEERNQQNTDNQENKEV